jgi:hypothetical protein
MKISKVARSSQFFEIIINTVIFSRILQNTDRECNLDLIDIALW